MKYSTLEKIPVEVKEMIISLWEDTYVKQITKRGSTHWRIIGILDTLCLTGGLTTRDYQDLINYYGKWFSL
jgi:hypothetical protein